ncbi:hypothetical protein GUJ93_ZPchr1274g29021 [Zizania palustris]|uniref:EF-hand domain-containing protein n=1 Tax=Zizania palustris TaxID=103762 RepID=A0A8J5RE43_ZIZPA|nr:hypothetical protein GUJ93_ZPchr1274g29021 [Zizania palustris]
MAPLLLLFLLGDLCALFSLSSAASSRASKKCGDVGEAKIRGRSKRRRMPRRRGAPGPTRRLTWDRVLDVRPRRRWIHHGGGAGGSLKRLGIAVSNAEAAAMVSRVDANNDGLIDIHEDAFDVFDVFDGNKDGLISAEELGTVLGSLGLHRHGGRPAVAECRYMIRLVDSDGDGMVSFEEFKRMMIVVKV